MVPGVEDLAQRLDRERAEAQDPLLKYQLVRPLLTADDIKRRLATLKSKRCLVVLLVDLTDVGGTLLTRVRDVCGGNPILLVGTKWDLFPPGARPGPVRRWLRENASFRGLKVVGTCLVSSHAMQGLDELIDLVQLHRAGCDVYVVGAANVGKSALVNALLQRLQQLQLVTMDVNGQRSGEQQQILPTESPMPGTTLDCIPVAAWATSGIMFDTPGLHVKHRVLHMLPPEELRQLQPDISLLQLRGASPFDIARQHRRTQRRRSNAGPPAQQPPLTAAASYWWGCLARMDVLQGPPSTTMVFQGPQGLPVVALPLATPADPPADTLTLADLPPELEHGVGYSLLKSVGLKVRLEREVFPNPANSRLGDIAISGLPGWVTLHANRGYDSIKLRVWAAKGAEVFFRPAMPFPDPWSKEAAQAAAAASQSPIGPQGYYEGSHNARRDNVSYEGTRTQKR